MDIETYKKRFDKMEKYLYENVFLKNADINNILVKFLRKSIKFLIYANIRFTLLHNCFLKALDEKIYEDDLSVLNKKLMEICILLDKIIEIIIEISISKE